MLFNKNCCCNRQGGFGFPMNNGCCQQQMEGPVMEPTITKCIEKEHSKILSCSPTHNFSDERLIKENIDEISQILK